MDGTEERLHIGKQLSAYLTTMVTSRIPVSDIRYFGLLPDANTAAKLIRRKGSDCKLLQCGFDYMPDIRYGSSGDRTFCPKCQPL
jgi:hypothetical protein